MIRKAQLYKILVFTIVFSATCISQWSQLTTNDFSLIHNIYVFGDTVYVCSQKGLFSSTDEGANWRMYGSSQNALNVNCMIYYEGVMYAGFKNTPVLQRYRQNTQSWESVDSGIGNNQVRALLVSGDTLYAATNNGVFSLSHGSSLWIPRTNNLTGLYAHSILKCDNNLYFTAFKADSGVFVSHNGGDTWEVLNNGLKTDGVYCIMSKDSSLYAGTYNGIVKSKDGGSHWDFVGRDSISKPVFQIISYESSLWAATSTGVYTSTDSGATWKQDAGGIDFPYVYTISVTKNMLLAGGLKLWWKRKEVISVTNKVPPQKMDFEVEALYPNPSVLGPSIFIYSYHRCALTIQVFSAEGRIFQSIDNYEFDMYRRIQRILVNKHVPGLYYCIISSAHQSVCIPFIIQ